MSSISYEKNAEPKNDFKALLVVYSFHHNNTLKIAQSMADVLDAQIVTPNQIEPDDIQGYDLVGFGSGIYGDKHHTSLLMLADKLPQASNQMAFLFSTSGMGGKAKMKRDHLPLREKLESKGYRIVDEFNCVGFDTNTGYDSGIILSIVSRFVDLIGGINKGRPNSQDLKDAEEFAENLLQYKTSGDEQH
jgi:flavodoxin